MYVIYILMFDPSVYFTYDFRSCNYVFYGAKQSGAFYRLAAVRPKNIQEATV